MLSQAYEGIIEGYYDPGGSNPEGCADTPEIDAEDAWSGDIPGGNWTAVSVAVDEAFKTDQFQVRFLLGSDRGAEELGWFVDEVQISVE